MKSLYVIYEGIYAKKELWDYYSPRFLDASPINEFLTKDFSERFIENYFKTGGKLLLTQNAGNLTDLRKMHTVSTFFLGLYLCDFLHVRKEEYQPDFRYLWFLTCLNHDVGYMYEGKIKFSKPEEDVYKVLNIPDDLKEYYTKKIIKNYSFYRRRSWHKRDHGIEGGRRLYDLLMKNYKLVQKKYSDLRDVQKPHSFVIDGLSFKETDKKYYAQVALYVMLHNIFFCNANKKEDVDKYKKFHLEKLIGKKLTYKPSLSLFFLLIFVDTIEPLKVLIDNNDETVNIKNYKTILENIFIDPQDDNLVITFCKKNLTNYAVDKWINNIVGMPGWINMSVTTEEQKFTLHVNTSD